MYRSWLILQGIQFKTMPKCTYGNPMWRSKNHISSVWSQRVRLHCILSVWSYGRVSWAVCKRPKLSCVVHEYRYNATRRHLMRHMFVFFRICTIHCNRNDCYCWNLHKEAAYKNYRRIFISPYLDWWTNFALWHRF